MTGIQARIRRFIADRPDGTASDRETYDHFQATRGIHEDKVRAAVLELAEAGHIVISEAGRRFSEPHLILDGRPAIGVRL